MIVNVYTIGTELIVAAQEPDLSPFYALLHNQKQGMIQAGDFQRFVLAKFLHFYLDTSPELDRCFARVQNSF